jgi:hypothetical protein
VESLASSEARGKYLELSRPMFELYTNLVMCNLAYLKIEKLRLLNEFKSCKEAAYAVFLKVEDCRLKLAQLKGKNPGILLEIGDFFALAEVFYQILAYYFLLVENDHMKKEGDFGFVKKEFQQMIYDNLVVIEEIEKLMATRVPQLNADNDNVMFGQGILAVVLQEVAK